MRQNFKLLFVRNLIVWNFGLLSAYYPSWNNQELRDRIYNTADRRVYEVNPEYETCNGNSGEDCFGYGMVDIYKAIGSSIFSNLVIDSLIFSEVSGDFDGVPNPGESINLDLALYNEVNWQEANNLSLELSCNNPNIAINNPTSFSGIINPGEYGSTTIPFIFTFSENSIIEEVYCNVNLSGTGVNGEIYNNSLPLTLDISISQSGFPLNLSTEVQSTPIVVDYDLDGDNDVFIGDYLGIVHKYDINGNEENPVEISSNIASGVSKDVMVC